MSTTTIIGARNVRFTHDGLCVLRQDVKAGATWNLVSHPDVIGGVCGEYLEPGDDRNGRARLLRQARKLIDALRADGGLA